MKTLASLLAACCLFAALPAAAQEPAHHDHGALPLRDDVHGKWAAMTDRARLQDAINGNWRSAANVARDRYRHPQETLEFFGLRSGQTVIEVIPSNGWYSEILAPFLREQGHYVAAVTNPASLENKFAQAPAQFDKASIVTYDPAAPAFGAPASADVVLTFRNVHNWRSAGQAQRMFGAFFAVLKPGGTLGVVEHRANGDVPEDDKTGYVGQNQVVALAEAAGFVFAGSSEINANPRDTKDYPGGVWTLPPTNRHDAADDAKYEAIGESDRMTLRFVKPAK